MTTATRLRPLASAAPARTPSARDGAGVALRALGPDDAAAVLEIFAGMGPRSRRLRFLTEKPRLTSAELSRLTAVDRRDHVAVLASSAPDGPPIGIARFIRAEDDTSSAEVAVAVVDTWQSRGIGTLLLDALAGRALDVGVRRFTMLVSDDNVAVRHLLQRSSGGVSRIAGGRGATEYAVLLDGGPSCASPRRLPDPAGSQ